MCVSAYLPPKEYSADVRGDGEEREREKNRCAVVCVCGGGALFSLIRLRQVAAHVKPLSADSNDTGRELRTRVTQRYARVYVCASASV